MNNVLDQITDLARRVCETRGLELVDAELFRAGRRHMIRVYVGRAGGVSIDDCAKVSREIDSVLEAENWLGEDDYVLEVSSPGLDRPFKTLADWRRNLGRDVRVTCREKFEGKALHAGKLVSADETEVVLEIPAKAGKAAKAPAKAAAPADSASGKPAKGAPTTLAIPMALVALAKIEVKLS